MLIKYNLTLNLIGNADIQRVRYTFGFVVDNVKNPSEILNNVNGHCVMVKTHIITTFFTNNKFQI